MGLTLWQDLDDLVHLLLESNLEDTIGLVDDESLQVFVNKSVGVLQVIKEPSWGGNDDIDALGQFLRFSTPVCSSHHNTIGLLMVFHELGGNLEDLEGQLPGGGDDNHPSAVAGLPLNLGQKFDCGDQKGKGLSTAGLGLSQHITACEQGRNGPPIERKCESEMNGERVRFKTGWRFHG